MRKWMTFSYTTNVRAHAGVTLQKIQTNKLNQKRLPRHVPFTTFVRLFVFPHAFPIRFVYLFVFSYAFTIRFVYLFVFSCAFPNVLSTCSFVCFFKCLSYTFCLVVRFICIKRAVFKHRNRHLWQVATFIKRPRPPFAANGLPFLSYLTCVN